MQVRLFILLFVIFSLNFSNPCFASKEVSYNIGENYSSEISDFSKNYTCDLYNLEDLFVALIKQRKFTDLITIYDKCIATYPNKSYLYNNRGNLHKMLKENELALEDYEKAISLDEKYINPYIGKASLLFIESKFDKALDVLDTVLKYEPKNSKAYYYRGLIFEYKNEEENALDNYTLAIKYSKVLFPSVYFYRGDLYYSYKKDYKKALSDYTKCIKIYEDNLNKDLIDFNSIGDVYFNRALTYYKLGDDKKIIIDLYKALEAYEQENNQAGVKRVKEILR